MARQVTKPDGVWIYFDKAHIYILIDPRSEQVRYVGLTLHPERRFTQHLSCPAKSPTAAWIRELKASRLLPRMVIVKTLCETKAHSYERRLIQKYRRELGDVLLNRNCTQGVKREKQITYADGSPFVKAS